MLNSYELSIPKLPGFDMGEWLKDQANIVQNLAQRANRVSPPQSMDQVQTMPYNPEDICVKKHVLIVIFTHVHPVMQLGFCNFSHPSTCDFPTLFALQRTALTRTWSMMLQMSLKLKKRLKRKILGSCRFFAGFTGMSMWKEMMGQCKDVQYFSYLAILRYS